MKYRHRLKFSPVEGRTLEQSEAYFYLVEGGCEQKLRFHDYADIYDRPGLYEQLFYERLRCASPAKVAGNLKNALDAAGQAITELRVLDLGAGNGVMGETLRGYGVARLIGADIIEAAKSAAERDRPGVYDEYYVADFCNLSPSEREEIEDWSVNCLTSVAALGFDDIPVAAFCEAVNFVADGGWVAFNIKESFLNSADASGFSRFIRELIFSKFLDLHHLERYRHRLSMEGAPLYYFSLVARKTAPIPEDFLRRCDLR